MTPPLFRTTEIDPRVAAALWGGGLGTLAGGVLGMGRPTDILKGGLIGAGSSAAAMHLAGMSGDERRALWRDLQSGVDTLWDKAQGLASGGSQANRGEEIEARAEARAALNKSGNLLGTAAPKAVDLARALFT